MKLKTKIEIACTAVVVIIVCLLFIRLCSFVGGDKPVVQTVTKVKPTPVNLDSIKRIGQLSVVTVELDQIVDTVDDGFFNDDEIEVMYHGTLHYGVDLTKVQSDWVRTVGDTAVYVKLPPVGLLDNRFLDERRVKVIVGEEDQEFINRPEVRANLVRKAKAEMIRKGDTHKAEAQEKVEKTMQKLFSSHGYKKVVVTFE